MEVRASINNEKKEKIEYLKTIYAYSDRPKKTAIKSQGNPVLHERDRNKAAYKTKRSIATKDIV